METVTVRVETPVSVYVVEYFDAEQARRTIEVRVDRVWTDAVLPTILTSLINHEVPRRRQVKRIIKFTKK